MYPVASVDLFQLSLIDEAVTLADLKSTLARVAVMLLSADNKVVATGVITDIESVPKTTKTVELSYGSDPSKLLESGFAGTTSLTLGSGLEDVKTIRIMPNMPCKLGQGVIAYSTSENVTKEEEDLFNEISLETCVNKRISAGSTGPQSVKTQIDYITEFLNEKDLQKLIS